MNWITEKKNLRLSDIVIIGNESHIIGKMSQMAMKKQDLDLTEVFVQAIKTDLTPFMKDGYLVYPRQMYKVVEGKRTFVLKRRAKVIRLTVRVIR